MIKFLNNVYKGESIPLEDEVMAIDVTSTSPAQLAEN